MINIIPAVLATTEEEYQQKISKLKDSGLFEDKWVQIDLMDNKFVQNQSIGTEVISKYPNNFKLEAHLMVEYPEAWIDELIKIGIDRIIFPVEDGEGIIERIEHIKNHNIEAGLSVNPETDISKLEPFIAMIDLILVMGVNPGFSGQEFIDKTLEKIEEVSRLRSKSNLEFKIEVDGGVNLENAKELVKSGVDSLVVGSHLFEGNLKENVQEIKENIQS